MEIHNYQIMYFWNAFKTEDKGIGRFNYPQDKNNNLRTLPAKWITEIIRVP